jgi:hypothetical protein
VCLSNRRDFRLLIADPEDTSKPIANPVIWLTTPVVTEVIFIPFYESKDLTKEITRSECICLSCGKKAKEIKIQ